MLVCVMLVRTNREDNGMALENPTQAMKHRPCLMLGAFPWQRHEEWVNISGHAVTPNLSPALWGVHVTSHLCVKPSLRHVHFLPSNPSIQYT